MTTDHAFSKSEVHKFTPTAASDGLRQASLSRVPNISTASHATTTCKCLHPLSVRREHPQTVFLPDEQDGFLDELVPMLALSFNHPFHHRCLVCSAWGSPQTRCSDMTFHGHGWVHALSRSHRGCLRTRTKWVTWLTTAAEEIHLKQH